jgi:hypothetical protein
MRCTDSHAARGAAGRANAEGSTSAGAPGISQSTLGTRDCAPSSQRPASELERAQQLAPHDLEPILRLSLEHVRRQKQGPTVVTFATLARLGLRHGTPESCGYTAEQLAARIERDHAAAIEEEAQREFWRERRRRSELSDASTRLWAERGGDR